MVKKDERLALEKRSRHESFLEELATFETGLQRENLPGASLDRKLEILYRLRKLEHQVATHFAAEERGGFLSEVVEVAPHLQKSAERLAGQHADIRTAFDAAILELEAMDAVDETAFDSIEPRISRLVDDLRAHEAEEIHLIQKAFYRDYGDAD